MQNSALFRCKLPATAVRSAGTFVPAKINANVLKAEYAVRGKLVLRAEEIHQSIKKGKKYDFDKVYFCNIGNPHALEQKPFTFMRQLISISNFPALLHLPALPSDVKKRSRAYVADAAGSTGAYSHSQGLPTVRKEVAAFLEERDGFAADPEDVFLTDGASAGIKTVLQMMIAHDKVGVMIPIPQYPLYSASIALFGGAEVPYTLTEEGKWQLTADILEASYAKAIENGTEVRALVIINPGNPTGAVLSVDNMVQIIKFAQKHNLVILADEVYQDNVHEDKLFFYSFRRILLELGEEYSDVELVSFHSTSKGVFGECGLRGGFMHLTNIAEETKEQIYKVQSISLCPNLNGQLAVGVMVNPPKDGDESFSTYSRELLSQKDMLVRRAFKTSEVFANVPGMNCNLIQGSMYGYPSFEIPPKAVEAAEKEGMSPCSFFAFNLLEATGVCVVPGKGFGQEGENGKYYFRISILPPLDEVDLVLKRVVWYYSKFRAAYA